MILSGYVNVRKKKEEKTIHISGQPFDTGRTQIDPERQTDRQDTESLNVIVNYDHKVQTETDETRNKDFFSILVLYYII